MDAAQKPLNYGDFLPAKKTRLSQKIDQSQGNFLRVKPRQAKAQQNLSVIDEISALSVPDSVILCLKSRQLIFQPEAAKSKNSLRMTENPSKWKKKQSVCSKNTKAKSMLWLSVP